MFLKDPLIKSTLLLLGRNKKPQKTLLFSYLISKNYYDQGKTKFKFNKKKFK